MPRPALYIYMGDGSTQPHALSYSFPIIKQVVLCGNGSAGRWDEAGANDVGGTGGSSRSHHLLQVGH